MQAVTRPTHLLHRREAETKMKKILLTGGGTAGHVTPNIALIPYLRDAGFEIEYMGSYDGIEKQLIEEQNIPYFGIDSGKLRRYASIKNLTDPFHIFKGLHEAKHYMKHSRPDIIFSKGGFVSVPVIFAASDYHIPIVIHESDLSPGLANKLSIPKADRICYNFPETKPYLPADKSIHTGLPVRRELLQGDPAAGYRMCGFDQDKPLLMIIGGSLGSLVINEAVRKILPQLLETYYVAHICGSGKMDETMTKVPGYKQFEYVGEGLTDLFSAASLIISRAGANVIYEIASLKKPSLLIPLDTNASRGDQILNANSFEKQGFSKVLREEALTPESLLAAVTELDVNRTSYISAMEAAEQMDAAKKVTEIIIEVLETKQSKR